ncbi:hypothetical protein ACFL1H_03370 [Nanoarchaeota archaeon]
MVFINVSINYHSTVTFKYSEGKANNMGMGTLEEKLEEKKPLIDKFKDWFYSDDNFYFRPKSFEKYKDGLIYRTLGVKFFKKYIPTGGSWINKKFLGQRIRKEFDKKPQLLGYERWTRIYETIHVPFFILMTACMGYEFHRGGILDMIDTTIINAVINFYPVILQRYNRALISNYLDKEKSNIEDFKENPDKYIHENFIKKRILKENTKV